MSYHMTVCNQPISCLSHIPEGLGPGKTIYVTGFIPHQSQQFSINVQCGSGVNPRDDIALHINVRFPDNIIVRNHLVGSLWGVEDRDGGLPLIVGSLLQIIILCEDNNFKVAFNGNHFCEFPYRLPIERCSHIAIDGDIIISLLQFNDGHHNPQSVKSNEIIPSINIPFRAIPPGIYSKPATFSANNAVSDFTEYKSLCDYGGFQSQADDENEITISVTDPQKVGSGISSYITYRVITKTNMKEYSKQDLSVSRRFNDFLGLYDQFIDKYLNQGVFIPPPPEKSIIGMTHTLMSDQSDLHASSGSFSNFIETRRASLERYLNRTAQNHILRIDPDFIRFLEADEELPKSPNTSALSGASMWRLFYRWRETVYKISYTMDETDNWFIDRCEMIDALDKSLQSLHSSVEVLASGSVELTSKSVIAARAASSLFTSENNHAVANALTNLANDQEKGILRTGQSSTDILVLSEILKEYIGLIGAIKDAFYERVKKFQLWRHAQLQLIKTRDAKLEAEVLRDNNRLVLSDPEIIEWERRVNEAQNNFIDISNTIRKELHIFELARAKEIRATIVKYLEDHMTDQAQLLKYWKEFMPEPNHNPNIYPEYSPRL